MMEANALKAAATEACKLADALLPTIQSRTVRAACGECRFVIYTDGTFESGRATWGAFLGQQERLPLDVLWGGASCAFGILACRRRVASDM